MAPHFAEEVYEHYLGSFEHPQPSVFRTGWIETLESWNDADLREEFQVLKQLRIEVNQLLEQARVAKIIGPSLEATVEIQMPALSDLSDEDKVLAQLMKTCASDLPELFITSDVVITTTTTTTTTGVALAGAETTTEENVFVREVNIPKAGSCRLLVRRATLHKCPRCWTFTSTEKDALCTRCAVVLGSQEN